MSYADIYRNINPGPNPNTSHNPTDLTLGFLINWSTRLQRRESAVLQYSQMIDGWWQADVGADETDLIDTEINMVDVSDEKDRSNEQSWNDPDHDERDDRSALSRVELLAASCRRLHREIMINAQGG